MNESVFLIKDERFEIERIPDFDLVLEFSPLCFRFCLIESNSKTVYWLEDYHIEDDNNFENEINEIFNNHLFLKAQYWNSITVILDADYFAFVPRKFFQETIVEEYLFSEKREDFKENFEIDFQNIEKLDAILAFAVLNNKIELVKRLYPESLIKLFSDIEVQIRTIKFKKNRVNIWLNSKNALVSFFKDDKFEGTYKIPLNEKLMDDFFTFFFKNNDKYEAFFYGEITIFSPWYKYLIKYFNKFSIKEPELPLKFSQYFQNVPLHRYICLFSSFIIDDEKKIHSLD